LKKILSMKNLILIPFLFVTLFGFGQSYLPVFQGYDSVYWEINTFKIGFIDSLKTIRPTKGFLEGIQKFDGRSYRLFKNRGWDCNTRFYIREDTLQQKIYARYDIRDSEDHLLYDFALIQGDTFRPSILVPVGTSCDRFDDFKTSYLVTKVENVSYFGKIRKTISLELINSKYTQPENMKLIEGVGSEYGFDFFNYCIFRNFDGFCGGHCVYKEFLYDFGEDCKSDITNTLEIETPKLEIAVFPNPVKNQIFIKKTAIEFRDVTKIEEVEKLDKGVYFLSIETESGVLVKRFIKN